MRKQNQKEKKKLEGYMLSCNIDVGVFLGCLWGLHEINQRQFSVKF